MKYNNNNIFLCCYFHKPFKSSTHLYRTTSQSKTKTIHQVTTMLATSKNVVFPGPKHWLLNDNQRVRSSSLVVSRWLVPGNRTFLEVASNPVKLMRAHPTSSPATYSHNWSTPPLVVPSQALQSTSVFSLSRCQGT